MTDERACLAFDSEPGAGLGHRTRIAAVAHELRCRGWTTDIVDVGQGIGARVAVVDSYDRRADEPGWIEADVVVALDDLARDLAVDVLVDPNPGAVAGVHRRARTVLAGPTFALLAPAVATLDPEPVRELARRVVVTTGGADRDGVGARIASALHRAAPDLDVALVVGPGADVAGILPGIALLTGRSDLAADLAGADVVVTAGGVTLLESLRLGRPTVAVVLAANQRVAAAGVAAEGAAVLCGPDEVAGAVASLTGDLGARRRLAANAARLVDGRGAARVVDVIERALT